MGACFDVSFENVGFHSLKKLLLVGIVAVTEKTKYAIAPVFQNRHHLCFIFIQHLNLLRLVCSYYILAMPES